MASVARSTRTRSTSSGGPISAISYGGQNAGFCGAMASACVIASKNASACPDRRPAVRHSTRPEGGIARPEPVPLPADLDHVVPGDDVEPFVLLVVRVARGPALCVMGDLQHEEHTAAVSRRDLDGERANAHAASRAEPVRVAGNVEAASCCVRRLPPPHVASCTVR
jgi:hypothetical protein